MNNEKTLQHHRHERKIKRMIKASTYSVIFCGILMSSPFGHSQGHDQVYERVAPEIICRQYEAIKLIKKIAGKDWDVVQMLMNKYGNQVMPPLSRHISQSLPAHQRVTIDIQ